MLEQIPLDCLRIIFQFCKASDLFSLSLSSAYFYRLIAVQNICQVKHPTIRILLLEAQFSSQHQFYFRNFIPTVVLQHFLNCESKSYSILHSLFSTRNTYRDFFYEKELFLSELCDKQPSLRELIKQYMIRDCLQQQNWIEWSTQFSDRICFQFEALESTENIQQPSYLLDHSKQPNAYDGVLLFLGDGDLSYLRKFAPSLKEFKNFICVDLVPERSEAQNEFLQHFTDYYTNILLLKPFSDGKSHKNCYRLNADEENEALLKVGLSLQPKLPHTETTDLIEQLITAKKNQLLVGQEQQQQMIAIQNSFKNCLMECLVHLTFRDAFRLKIPPIIVQQYYKYPSISQRINMIDFMFEYVIRNPEYFTSFLSQITFHVLKFEPNQLVQQWNFAKIDNSLIDPEIIFRKFGWSYLSFAVRRDILQLFFEKLYFCFENNEEQYYVPATSGKSLKYFDAIANEIEEFQIFEPSYETCVEKSKDNKCLSFTSVKFWKAYNVKTALLFSKVEILFPNAPYTNTSGILNANRKEKKLLVEFEKNWTFTRFKYRFENVMEFLIHKLVCCFPIQRHFLLLLPRNRVLRHSQCTFQE